MADKRLGKGLEALITSYSTDSDRYMDGAVPIKQIMPNHNQPRKDFNAEQLAELTLSIKSSGILQPLTVREMEDGKFELIAGERRLRAAKEAGLETVPVYILSIDADVEMMEYALIENVQRVDLNPIEEAEGYAILSGKYDLTDQEISDRVGKSEPAIRNARRLLKLPPNIKMKVKSKVDFKKGIISAGHARALLGLDKSFQMVTFYKKIIREELSVRQIENLVKKYSKTQLGHDKLKKISYSNPEITRIENNLISQLGTKVVINKNNKGKGKILIKFDSDSDLQRILDIISES